MDKYRIYLTGVGGQGTLLATVVLAESAIYAGYNVVASEVHGMAQRGGVVESTVMIGDIKSSIISDGEADVLLGFEPLETYRAIRKCSAGSVVVSNTVPVIPYGVAIGKGSYPDVDKLLDFIGSKVKRLITIDAQVLAQQAGAVLSANMAMLGALAKSGALPVPKEAFEETIRTKTKASFVETNLRAFELGLASQ
ncbi:MAG: indolepyruvate oxidoreductase subunit beta [Deltaproteobacteria bacterium]|nr:indolepyruvate oxidoreductase subunit beta [Deltaproteobacteria bacterium]RLB89004.1 MAG: pyruvate ferredoxin oxidoreductase [Deltaproteobacteria bacterium]RLB94174.1 MAG: pyruvate ferredoxin oxidoreductase [Deltaproteobacteria bacterium]RLC10655.1 MAG: pyruvate ferredoxin oxidoreductase [Deltaproteobacteria bacterium]